ncbi:MAG: tyrosine-type recombinase/integrase [Gemmatimonadetes bacterium]|nr:tyrosine-type recombinase/integrase [Gemmatimonadota bacterium]
MPRRKTSRIYWRRQGGERRAYGDFRDFQDVLRADEPARQALIPPDGTRATTDPDLAAELATARVKELEERRRSKVLLGVERLGALQEFADHHLRCKAREGSVTKRWLAESQHRLERAVEFFGADRVLASIKPQEVRDFAAWLSTLKSGRGGTLSGGTVRHHLNDLSNLFRRGAEDRSVPTGWNPVAALTVKPTAARAEERWLEVHEAALFLEAARLYKPKRRDLAQPYVYGIVATFLLTGGRQSEVFGLLAEDVSFDRGTITFRPHPHRRLKTRTSHRVVPLFPQLRTVLQEHIFGAGRVSGLLFPSPAGTGMVTDLRKALDAVAELAGFAEGEIRTKMFRHTYCAAALQLVDRGAPVSPWTVAKWMGHGGQNLVDRVYGHLGDVRHRSEVVEFRVEQHMEKLRERLERLGERLQKLTKA